MDKHRETYREEASELLTELETALMELEKIPEDQELIGRVFRAMHTIKGSGAMFGFEDVAAFTHDVETVYDHVRNGKIPVSKHLVDLTLSACDQIRGMIEPGADENKADEGAKTEITSAFKKLLGNEKDPVAAGTPPLKTLPDSRESTTDVSVTYRILLWPEQGLFASGTNPLLLLNELRGLGTCRVVAHTGAIPELSVMNPEACYTYWDIVLTTSAGINAVRDVFIFVEDSAEIKIDVIDQEGFEDEEGSYKKLGEILVDRGEVRPGVIQEVLSDHKRIGERLIDAGLVDPEKVHSALVEQKHVREVRRQRQAAEAIASIRVPAEKLDALVNMVGELVTIQSRLSQRATVLNDPEFRQIAEEMDRLTAALRDNTMSIRMLPIGTTFSKFKRLVRDLSGELGKEIVLATEGAETELDKTVIERLNDPLVHLIRNSIDHGIETPSAREAAGKPRQGTIHLSASHAGAHVLIKVRDDGAGLDKERIRLKAIEKGLITPDAAMQEKDIFSLIFLPGFSTAEKVTSVSGRGVGMDVVRKNIDALRGSIEVGSEKGVGTTITLKLPLTLAIVDGLLVKVEGSFYVVPLSSVEECVELTREDVARAHGRNMIPIRGELVPYVSLRERFLMKGERPEIERIVTSRVGGSKVGVLVDQVIGQHQTVIKSLGRAYQGIREISGATILGDGTLALILELGQLVQDGTMKQDIRRS
ncbi:MAG: chemotaxis protein CheA [Thermodesulfobacteriota bacterium]